MPAYDRPIEFHVDRSVRRVDSVAAVIKFQSNDLERIQKFLNELAVRGIIEPTKAHEYNSEHGGPVWYIP
jgi:hypothetical protein